MPTLVDFAFVFALVVLATAFEHYVFWPRFRAEVAAGLPDARVRGYRRGVLGQWAFAVVAIGIWAAHHRSLEALRLTPPAGWRAAVGPVLVALIVLLVAWQLRAVGRLSPAVRVKAQPRLGALAFLLPHTPREYRWFLLLSATAGICEELLYRGYLTWVLAPWLGVPGAFVAATLLFGVAHSYQGRKGAVRATAAGAVLALVVLGAGWLVPAMIVHALVDAGSGTVGYRLLSATDPATVPGSEDRTKIAS